MVNDVTALRGDAAMAGVVAAASADLCLMHMQGTPRTMQDDPRYDDVVEEVATCLAERVERPSRPASTRGASASTPASASARPSRTTCRCWRTCRGSCERPGGPCWWASRASASSASLLGDPARDRTVAGVTAGSRRSTAAPGACACTTSAPHADALPLRRAIGAAR